LDANNFYQLISVYCMLYVLYTVAVTWAVHFSYLGYCDILLCKYDLCVYSLTVAVCTLGLGSMLEAASLRSGSWLGY
jgi:hypothetical protein